MRTALYAAAALTLGFLAAGASSRHAGAAEGDGPILPGYWESTSKDSLLNAGGKTERKCITARAINAYLTGPVNSHYRCRYDSRDLNGGHAHMTGECTDASGIKGKVVIDGDYSPEAFRLNGKLTVAMLGLNIPIDTSIDAHRLSGECPAGVKVEDAPAQKGDAAAPNDAPSEGAPRP